jgi:cellulose synthase/poly-beta-1,6-N-acetylglucosamine synthase-like glycosyltransferase
MANCLALDYPRDKLQLLFVTDGSTDGSEVLLKQYPGIKVMHQSGRKGKYAAIERAMGAVHSPVVVFSDCNAMLNPGSLLQLVRHFADPGVGAVAGEKKVQSFRYSSIGQAEGMYWKYESFLKRLDARLHTVVGAAGELFAIRTALFRPTGRPVILDDFYISMQTCLQGYRIAYEPAAFATEPPSASLEEEQKRKVRIAAGASQALGLLPGCLNFFRRPLLAFQYFSRRVLRWVACPLALIILFASACYGTFVEGNLLSTGLFAAQCICYLAATAGWIAVATGRRAGFLAIPFYFLFMNWCMIRGFARFLSGKQSAIWERSVREVNG